MFHFPLIPLIFVILVIFFLSAGDRTSCWGPSKAPWFIPRCRSSCVCRSALASCWWASRTSVRIEICILLAWRHVSSAEYNWPFTRSENLLYSSFGTEISQPFHVLYRLTFWFISEIYIWIKWNQMHYMWKEINTLREKRKWNGENTYQSGRKLHVEINKWIVWRITWD